VPAPFQAANAPAPAAVRGERKLQLSFDNGAVTLVAQNVTVREILADWQRRNGCQFVNAEKLAGGPVTLEFSAKPELEVIDSLLRGVAGYMVGPRSDAGQTGSMCGIVYILPTSVATSSVSYAPMASVPAPLAAPLMQPGMPDDEIAPVAVQINSPQPVPARTAPNPGAGPQGQPGQAGQPQPAPPGQAAPAGFGPVPVTPTVPGAGRIGGPPPTGPTPTNGGRGGGLP
jgi:hypothetical protein